ncbi:MAG TPA: hypothetical protein VIG24_08980 [Acidimicrobiia bacterium]
MSPASSVRNVEEFDKWLAKAERGDSVVYHRGRHAGGPVCQRAMALQEAGLVNLVQRRVDKEFQFEAQRTKMRRKKK